MSIHLFSRLEVAARYTAPAQYATYTYMHTYKYDLLRIRVLL
jgi:hypothetical protein